MTYQLGVDLGTTYTSAAIRRDGRTRIFELGNRTSTIPSVIYLGEDGTVLTGEAANRRGVTEPNRVVREFKRRIGDPTPILLGGTPYSAEALSAKLLSWVIERVSEREGSHPGRVAVTHPANWGPYKLDLLEQAVRMANLEDVVTLTEPEAAAIHYASMERIDPGMIVAVFDLGGGTFDAATLKKTEAGFEFLGRPEGIERLGGIDFDEAVFGFVGRSLGGALQELDPTDPTALAAVARLRAECVEAKEALSGDTEAAIPVVLPNVQTEVRLTRGEFEQLIRPSLADAISAMRRAVRTADLEMEQIDLVLLVGGSSRIPLIGQMVGGELGRPIAIDAHPKHSVALGAARAAADEGATHPVSVEDTGAAVAAVVPPEPIAPSEAVAPSEPVVPSEPIVPAAAAAPLDHTATTPPDGPNKGLLIGIAVVVIVAIIAGVVFLGGGGDSGDDEIVAGESPFTVDEDTSTTAAAVTTTVVEVTTTEATTTTEAEITTTTEPPFVCLGFCSVIEEIDVVDGELSVTWTAHNFSPDVGNIHVHFFFDVFRPSQVGLNFDSWGETVRGSWDLTDQIPYSTAGTSLSMSNVPSGATQLCVTPTDSQHGVLDPEKFDCVDIPAEFVPG
ncbi:MAG: Hsp70 family protein [Actinomycetia bacterium]|nr:Hsp70 family protein [Actinomycetes bacterium]